MKIFIFVLSILICELFLRFIFYSKPQKIYQQFGDTYRLIPNSTFKIRHTIIKTNSEGFNTEEIGIKEKKRMIFLGDSHAQGLFGMPNFVEIVREEIPYYEVINFGINGYGIEEELKTLKFSLKYQPDRVILMFCNGNDLGDFGGRYVQDGYLYDRVKPKKSWRSYIFESGIYRLISLVKELMENKKRFGFVDKTNGLIWNRKQYTDEMNESVNKYIKVLDEFVQVCRKNKIELFIIFVPTMEQVKSKFVYDYEYDFRRPQSIIKDWCNYNDVEYYDPMYEMKRCDDMYVKFDGHMNSKGHSVIGKLIVRYFTIYRQ